MNAEQMLINKNTKPTSMRILVYEFLAEQSAALSLSEIEMHFHHADRITLYRTLKTFEEKGIVHSIPENNTTKYKLCNNECTEHIHNDRHLHFYCKICRQTTCEENFVIPDNRQHHLHIEEIHLFAKGICEKCLPLTLQ